MKCKICNFETVPALNLERQPLANDYEGERGFFPLAVNHCPACGHGQLASEVDPKILFSHYPYVTGTSQTLRTYCEEFAEMVTRENDPDGALLEIGCNDGTQLRAFKSRGWNIHGCDPASNMAKAQEGLPVLREFWNLKTADEWEKSFDIIVAQNVLAHVPDPVLFLAAVRLALKPDGIAYIQTSQADWLRNAEFDCVYHEHFSYFCPRSLAMAALKAGFDIERIEKTLIHGGSLLLKIKKTLLPSLALSPSIDGGTLREEWRTLHYRVRQRMTAVNEFLEDQEQSRKPVYGLGAPAKATVWLNAAKTPLRATFDENPAKIGKYVPGTKILIGDLNAVGRLPGDVCFLILAWNFAAELRSKVEKLRPYSRDRFLVAFPEIKHWGTGFYEGTQVPNVGGM